MDMASPGNGDTNSQDQPRPVALPACEACRRLKMKCNRAATQSDNNASFSAPCDRCKRTNRPCKIPESRPLGRRPGSLGRYRGLHKAYRKLQEEAKKANISHGLEGALESLAVPTGVELEVQAFSTQEPTDRRPPRLHETIYDVAAPAETAFLRPGVTTPTADIQDGSLENVEGGTGTDPLHEPMSNPLALLAYASDAAQACEQSSAAVATTPAGSTLSRQSGHNNKGSVGYHLLHRPGYVSLGLHLDRASLVQGLDYLLACDDNTAHQSFDYFKRTDAYQRDVRPDLDPVTLGLVTMEDASHLFPIYFARLHPLNGILDPMLHTPEFVRARSSLLFTWLLALTAQFDHASAAMAERLRLHGEKLSRYVHTCGYKSVEIVQGYYISLLSATPAKTLAEERSWLYTMYAIGIALDLGMDQESPAGRTGSQSSQTYHSNHEFPSPYSGAEFQETFSAEKSHEERLRRNRERTWLRILLWERANSAARGCIQSFPESSLTRSIETWWLHPMADMTDKYTTAFIVLRKVLAALQLELKQQAKVAHHEAHWARELVDNSLQNWCDTWLRPARDHTTSSTSPLEQVSMVFLRYVYEHGRLWTLSLALSESVSRVLDLDAIRQDCFESAIQCCEAAVRDLHGIGEPLHCMLAPTWAMIAYAAVLTLKLFPVLYGTRPGCDVELIALLSQVALQLHRAGTTPPHRFGIAALLGQHLMMILRTRVLALKDERPHLRAGDYESRHGQPEQLLPVSASGGSGNPLVSDWDPFLTPAVLDQNGDAGDRFDDIFRDIFGPVFGELA
ncbi:hypothetical protein BJX64DRAFT_300970 [Aspergillus heterothallicus]